MIPVFNCDNAMLTSLELSEYAQCVIITPMVLKGHNMQHSGHMGQKLSK